MNSFKERILFAHLDMAAHIPPCRVGVVRDFTEAMIRFWQPRATIRGLTRAELLARATEMTEFDFLLIQSTGHAVMTKRFFAELEQVAAREPFLVMGHILDRGDRYYELHHQCTVVDLRQFRALGCPAAGDSADILVPVPERSRESVHDSYTPLWLRPGGAGIGSYRPRGGLWNLIRASLDAGLSVLNFGDTARSAKIHLYPEDDASYSDASDLLKEMVAVGKRMVYVYNTDQHTVPDTCVPLDCVVAPAAGFSANYHLRTHGFTDNTVVIHFDYSAAAIEFRKHLIDRWDGGNYEEFVHSAFRAPNSAVLMPLNWRNDGPDLWREHLMRMGGTQLWRGHWSRYRKLKHVFVECDLTGQTRGRLTSLLPDSGNVLFDMSNIWTVPQTFFGRTARDVDLSFGRFMDALRSKNPSITLVGHDPRWRYLPYKAITDVLT